MSFLSIVTDFFDSIFHASSPEVKNRQAVRRIENELKMNQPPVYKNGLILPVVGEAFYNLYKNTKIIDDIFSQTLFTEDLQRNAKYADLLISTGFTPDLKEQLRQLNYDFRYEEAQPTGKKNYWMEEQRHRLEVVLKGLNTNEFYLIEKVLNSLEQLSDVCRFNYLTAIHKFDRSFSPDAVEAAPHLENVPLSAFEDVFSDLYYVSANLNITSSMARAIVVLEEQRQGGSLENGASDRIVNALKKIASMFRHVLTPENLLGFMILIKNDPEIKLSTETYDSKPISQFSQRLQQQFSVDEQRIKTELKDNMIAMEQKDLFGVRPIMELTGYNSELNTLLQRNGAQPLLWITPIQIVKTFVMYYFSDGLQNFLNGIVVEGFFNNATYKSSFSAAVFACSEAKAKIAEFENYFAKGGELDLALIKSYVNEGRQNQDLLKKLSSLIDIANNRAFELTESIATMFAKLEKSLDTLLVDAKKSKPEFITNIKVLFMSTRNRDIADMLEKDFYQWRNFLEIMKNYVIINNSEK